MKNFDGPTELIVAAFQKIVERFLESLSPQIKIVFYKVNTLHAVTSL